MKTSRHKCNETNCGAIFNCWPCHHTGPMPVYCSERCEQLNPPTHREQLDLGNTQAGREDRRGGVAAPKPNARNSSSVCVIPPSHGNARKRR